MVEGSDMSKREYDAVNEIELAQQKLRSRMNRRLGRVVNMSVRQYRQIGFLRRVH